MPSTGEILNKVWDEGNNALKITGGGGGGGVSDLQGAFDGGQTITIADGDNQTLAVTQSDTTNNPDTVTIANAGSGDGLSVDQNGDGRGLYVDHEGTTADAIRIDTTVTSGRGLIVVAGGVLTGTAPTSGALVAYNNSASSGGVASISQDNASATGKVLYVYNDGTGAGLLVDQNGNGTALNVDSESTTAHVISVDTVLTGARAIWVNNTAAHTSGDALVRIKQSNGSTTMAVMELENQGTGAGLLLDQNGAGPALKIDQAANATHINFVGDPSNSSPTDGDWWYDGTNLKFYDGTATRTISWT